MGFPDLESRESIKTGSEFDAVEEEDSPCPKDCASVSNVDDPEMPALTSGCGSLDRHARNWRNSFKQALSVYFGATNAMLLQLCKNSPDSTTEMTRGIRLSQQINR